MTFLLWLVACTGPGPEVDPGTPALAYGDAVVCPEPTTGRDRFVQAANARGLSHDFASDPAVRNHRVKGGEVVAVDHDGDGDVDVSFGHPTGWPRLFVNDGTGHFEPHELGPDFVEQKLDRVHNHAVLDLDGDGWRDIVLFSTGRLRVAWGLGPLSWADPADLYVFASDYPAPALFSAAFGDIDGDGDLDIAVPTADMLLSADDEPFDEPPLPGADDVVLMQRDGAFELAATLPGTGDEPGVSLLASLTDLDADGDLDLMVPSDWGCAGRPPSALYDNRGVDGWAEVGAELGLDFAMSGMGIDGYDRTGDGLLDYVISDVTGFRCPASMDGAWFDTCFSMGLDHPIGTSVFWFGWSVEAVDLDNDGLVDLAAAGGFPFDPSVTELDLSEHPQSDGLWFGSDVGFDSVGAEVGFDDVRDHFGLAAADLDGDGFVELVVAGTEGQAVLWENACGDGHWTEIGLVGFPGNPAGYGARVEVEAGGQTRVRELAALRGMGQGPARLHFGLGGVDAIDRVTVRFPDGAVAEHEDVPVDRLLTVAHPDMVGR